MACLLTCEQDSGQLGRDGGGKAGSGRELLPPIGGEGQWGEGGWNLGAAVSRRGPWLQRREGGGGDKIPSRSPELRLPWVQPIWGTKQAEKDGEWTGRGTHPSAFSIHPCSVGDMCPQHPGRTMLH